MSTSPFNLDLSQLSVPERLDLIEQIWVSIEADSGQLELTPDERDELDRREAAYLANPQNVVRWEDVKVRYEKPQ